MEGCTINEKLNWSLALPEPKRSTAIKEGKGSHR